VYKLKDLEGELLTGVFYDKELVRVRKNDGDGKKNKRKRKKRGW
jgi:hypothetical protein